MATDLSDYQLDGAREFLRNLAKITVGTEKLDRFIENDYNISGALIEHINKQRMYHELLTDKTNDLKKKVHDLERRVRCLEDEVQEFIEPLRHQEKMTSLSPEVELELRDMMRNMIQNFSNTIMQCQVRQIVRDMLRHIDF